jgi:hypothetical protein
MIVSFITVRFFSFLAAKIQKKGELKTTRGRQSSILHFYLINQLLLHFLKVSILDVVALLTALLACVGTGLRTCLLTTGLCVHLCTSSLEGSVEFVHRCVDGCEVL